ncbi:MAG: Serine-protein kinase RsbW [Candidatus Anoxychlamydiales bacterium]|nr:Serine-protein kinase RsbW [Candidatus Anoxychlamydiales bacterium]
MEKKSFFAKLENLYPMLIWIRERISKYFAQKDLEKVELACEEAIVNIIKHGYKTSIKRISISIELNDFVDITFKDTAKAFNPLKHKRKKISRSIKNKKVGGLGIHLMLSLVDEVTYDRKDLHNIFTLRKKRSKNY